MESAGANEKEIRLANRFDGPEGKRRLVDALRAQVLVSGDENLAKALAEKVEVKEFAPGTEFITQDSFESDLFLILVGAVVVLVNGREIAKREAGCHIGEMSVIDPTAKRSATVRTVECSLLGIISEENFSEIANRFPALWRRAAVELANRLRQRAKYHRQPNDKPMVFIGSSKETLHIAEQIQKGIISDEVIVKLWTDGIFEASQTTIESLAAVLEIFDFGIIVLGPDDLVISRGAESSAPRDNAIFELGLLMGGFGRKRTYIVKQRGTDLKIPSDLLGITCLEVDCSSSSTLEASASLACDQLRAQVTGQGPR